MTKKEATANLENISKFLHSVGAPDKVEVLTVSDRIIYDESKKAMKGKAAQSEVEALDETE